MGKQKKKASAFSEFMFEFIEKERRAGRRYPKEQYHSVAAPRWNALSEAEKERYKQMAKSKPARIVVVPAKCSSQGVLLADIERHRQEQEAQRRYMEDKIKTIVHNAFENKSIATMPIYFLMGNYFYKTHEGLYPPAEIAIGKFTLKDGLNRVYHSFINPGTIEMGYAWEARDHSRDTHQLPVPGNGAMGEKDFENVYKGLLDILGINRMRFNREDMRKPCVFARKEDMPMLHSILDQLSDKMWSDGQHFDLFHLELLFNELKNVVNPDEKLRVTVTNIFVEQDKYDMVSGISCDFHERNDATKHCALSYVRRWYFLFADHICEHIGVRLVPGKHVPANARLDPAATAPWEENEDHVPKKMKSETNDDDDKQSECSGSSSGIRPDHYTRLKEETDSDEDDADDSSDSDDD